MTQKHPKTLVTALLIGNLLFIWGNSLLPASVSGAISQWAKELLEYLLGIQGGSSQGDGLLRKLAHFLEFTSLGLLLGWRWAISRPKSWRIPALLSGVSVAFADELLQHLAPGRAPRMLDVGIDTLGVTLGITLLILGTLYKKKQNN